MAFEPGGKKDPFANPPASGDAQRSVPAARPGAQPPPPSPSDLIHPGGPDVPLTPAARANATRKNWMGITALILSLLGPGLLSVIFGVLGLQAVKNGEADNRGVSVAALWVNGGWVALFGLFFAGTLFLPGFSDALDDTTAAGDQVSWSALRVGDCIDVNAATDTSEEIVQVDGFSRVDSCDEAHTSQVFWTQEFANRSWPGDDALLSEGEAICWRHVDTQLAADLPTSMFVSYYFPTKESWRDGDRRLTCVVEHATFGGSLHEDALAPDAVRD